MWLVAVIAACGWGAADVEAPSTGPRGVACPVDRSRAPGCFVQVPAHEAILGASMRPGDPGYDPDATAAEGPERRVVMPSFWVQRTEATAAQWRACVAQGVCDRAITVPEGTKDSAAIVGLSLEDGRDLCGWLGGAVPTADQWEAAARAGDRRRFGWGDRPACPYIFDHEALDHQPWLAEVLEACAELLAELEADGDAMSADEVGDLVLLVGPEAARRVCVEVTDAAGLRAGLISAAVGVGDRGSVAGITCEQPTSGGIGMMRLGHPWGLVGTSGGAAELVEATSTHVRGGSWLSDDLAAMRIGAVRSIVGAAARTPDAGVRCVAAEVSTP